MKGFFLSLDQRWKPVSLNQGPQRGFLLSLASHPLTPADGFSGQVHQIRSGHVYITVVDRSTILSIFKMTSPELGEEDSSGEKKKTKQQKRALEKSGFSTWASPSPPAFPGSFLSSVCLLQIYFPYPQYRPLLKGCVQLLSGDFSFLYLSSLKFFLLFHSFFFN